MRPWFVAAVWCAWIVVSAGTGYTPSRPRDKIADRATRVSVRADAVVLVSMAGAIAAAVWLPSAALPGSPWLGVVVGVALVACGLAVRHWAARTLGSFFTRSVAISPDHRVVTTGPYRYVRHPGYAGALLSLVGLALTLWNWASLLVILIGSLIAYIPRIRAEEAALEESLDGPYREFQRTRQQLIPGIW